MTFIFKASLSTCMRQWIPRTNCTQRNLFIHLSGGFPKQVNRALTQARFYSTEEKNFSSDKTVRLYDGILSSKVRLVKIFSLSTSAVSMLVQPYLVSKVMLTESAFTIGGVIFAFSSFALVTPVILHLIIKRYIIHIDYNPIKDTYIATTYSILAQKKQLEFKPEDVHLPTMSEMLTSCVIKGNPLFIDVQSFRDIDHYRRIMGFDKPMDFQLNHDDIKPRNDSSVPR